MRKDSLTEEQLKWLKEHVDDSVWDVITRNFNKHFGTNKTKHSLMNKCQREKIYKTNKDVFLSVKGSPVGTERIRKDESGRKIYWVKISNKMKRRNSVGNYNQIWKAKHHIVYESVYGNINKNEVVVFLDGDTLNCSANNLYKVNMSVQCKMIRNEWFSNDPAITLAAIKWCELEELLETKGKKN